LTARRRPSWRESRRRARTDAADSIDKIEVITNRRQVQTRWHRRIINIALKKKRDAGVSAPCA